MTDTIYVYGKRMEDSMCWAAYEDPDTGVEPNPTLSPDGSGGGTTATKLDFSADDICAEGAAKKIGEHIVSLLSSVGPSEYGTYLQKNSDTSFAAHQNGIYTNHDPLYAKLPRLLDYSSIRGTVHNHVWNSSTVDPYINHINRYPGPEDWGALDEIVSPTNGAIAANPDLLSVYITDPWGDTKEFLYRDRELYQQMDDTARINGENLPDEVQECTQ